MSRRGDNIRKRKDGRWEGRYIFFRDDTGKAIYRSVYGRTYAAVKERLEAEAQNFQKRQPEDQKETINELAERWLCDIKINRKYSTYVKYHSIFENHIREYLGKRKVYNLSADDCIAFIRKEYFSGGTFREPLSKSTVNSICNVLSQIMEYGNQPVSISYNDCRIAAACDTKAYSVNVFTKDEQKRLQAFLLNDLDNYKLGIYVCMMTGLRLGEICALRTKDIDLAQRRISVTQTVQRIKSEQGERKTELRMDTPKTTNSKRVIPICDILFATLEEHMSCSDYLVNGSRIMEPRTYQYFFCKILKQLSISRKNFHSLRHTFATNCIDSGMDPKCLSEILGHSDVKTTLNRYVHPSFEQKMKQLNSFASDKFICF